MLKGQGTQAWPGLGLVLRAGKAHGKLCEIGQEWLGAMCVI